MIRALRARHRWMSVGLALAALGGLNLAWLSRTPAPVMPTLPPPLQSNTLPEGEVLLQSDTLWEGASIQTTLTATHLVLSPLTPLRAPDPLVYWSPTAPEGDALPQGARLLGTLSDAPEQVYPLASREGAVLVYSLGHDRVVAWASLGGP